MSHLPAGMRFESGPISLPAQTEQKLRGAGKAACGIRRLVSCLLAGLSSVALTGLIPQLGGAQQVTYNSFDTAAAVPGQTSQACTTTSAANGVLFCFNSFGSSTPPAYVLDSYPAALDPNGGAGGQYYALQLTKNDVSQGTSVWYAIPQNVAGGFNLWYAFKINFTGVGEGTPGDGMALLIQNALGNAKSLPDPYANATSSVDPGSGVTAIGQAGGGLGYGGIDNSVALEMDTFPDNWDPWDQGVFNYFGSHMALQSCGIDASTGSPIQNSPAHYLDQTSFTPTSCLIKLNGTGAIVSKPNGVSLYDGNPHQVVVVYNGPNDSPANYLYVYIDPSFVPGTHTPVAGSTPILSGPFDLTQYIKLSASSAYLGFTASTGGSAELHELMGFAFTPHSPSTTVSVSGAGNGSGSVTTTPAAINCALNGGAAPTGSCSVSYSTGSELSFSATPSAGSAFAGWGGACAGQGTNPVCTLSITDVTAVSATFNVVGPPPPDTIAVTLSGNGGGTVTDNASGINCTLAGGKAPGTGTCSFNYPAGSQLTLTATTAAGSSFTGWGIPCAGSGLSCTFTVDNSYNISATFQQQNFGTVNVCPAGTSLTSCSQSLTVTFNVPQNTILGAVQVVTQGAAGLDFALADAGTCSGTITGGNGCTLTVTFAPLAPGLRAGAVTLLDSAGHQVATQAIYGVGQAPLAAFSPSTPVPISTGSFALSHPAGVLVDAFGNLIISDEGTADPALYVAAKVLKVGPDGTTTSIGSGWQMPQGMAEDGAGNLFVADNNQNQVVEIPAGCTSAACQKIVPNPLALRSQLGVAVDPAGNLFVGDFLDGQVAKVPADGSAQTIVYSPGVGSNPVDLTTDAAGNLYVADFGLKTVAEVPAGCTIASCVKKIGVGWSQPDGVAIDAAGDVFVADEGLRQIIEVPFGCISAGCQITLASNVDTVAVKVDSNGNVVYDDLANHQILALGRTKPSSLNFAITNVGSLSSAQPVSLQNVGNQPLTGSLALSGLGVNFSGSGSCNSFALTPGASCVQSFTFAPQTTGYFTGNAVFSDNTLNLSAAVTRQQVTMTGIGGVNGVATTTAVPNVIGLTQAAAGTALTNSGLTTGSISTSSSDVVPVGSVIASNPAAGTQVALSSAVKLLVSSGPGQPPTPNPLSLMNNYFVTGDYASAGVTLRGAAAVNGRVTGTINIPASTGPGSAGVPTGADLIDGFLYWMTLENSASPSGANAMFLGYGISGQQVGKDLPYTDGNTQGTLRVYRANVNAYFQNGANGIRVGSGAFTISLPGNGTNGVLLTEGASLVVIYRVLSPNFPLKAVVIYEGAAIPPSATSQTVLGFYDVASFGNANAATTSLYVDSNGWNNSSTSSPFLLRDRFDASLNAGAAYGAVIASAAVNSPDNDGILSAWKAGPAASDFHGGEPGYYDVKTGLWVALPGARAGQKDLFVQLDYMCGGILSDGSCDPTKENLFPSPDAQGNDPLLMVQQAFANSGIALHLQVGNAIAEDTCADSAGQPCQFPGQPGVVGWKNSLLFSKVWPRSLTSCATGGDCSPRFAYGQKDSYHYVLFGRSLAIPAWNTRYGSLVSINAVAGGQTTIKTTDRGTGINKCPSRITVAGIQGAPSLNGVYTSTTCPDSSTIIVTTPAAQTASWVYPNSTLSEPIIGITSGTVTSISGYSDLGGADSAVTLGLWETSGQDMSKRANVIAGTLFHELGHTIGLGHGGLYYDSQPAGSYVPTFEANCKPNYQSIMNYLFQLDGVGQGGAIAFSNQMLSTLTLSSLSTASPLTVAGGGAATFPTSTWYTSTAPSSTASPATLHCDGTPLAGDVGYRVSGPIAPITPAWTNGQNITFDGQPWSSLRGFNDLANIDLRQVGATGGQLASLASLLAFGSSYTPLNIAPGGSVSVGPGGTVTLGAGGNITLGGGGNVTIPSGASISGGGTITFGTGGSITLSGGGIATGTFTAGTNGSIGLPSGGTVTLGGGGTITLGAGGTVTLGAGGTVTLGAGGTISLSGSSITIPAGGSYTVPAGGTITLGGGGTVTLGGGGNVTLGGGGTITLGAGGTVTLGGGGNVTLGAGGTVTLGGGGTVTLGGGGNVTLGGGGTITLGGGGNVTLGGGGTVTLGGGGTVTLGAGGDISVGAGGNVTLGAGGTVTLGAGGNITLGAGGTVTLGGGGNVTLGGGGTITLGGGGTITMNAAGTVTLGAGGGTIGSTPEPAGTYFVGAGGTITLGGGGTVTLGAGGNVTLGAGGNITLGAGGTITLGGGGTVTLGGGGTVTLGAGGNVTLGAGGNVTLGAGGNITLGGGGNVTLGGGGVTTTELDYDSANSVVRPPPAATYTVVPSAVRVDWTAPAFGVVQTYTISRSVNGAPAVVIGSVSGVNGNPPATTFFDTNPATSGTVVYTIATTLVPDPGTNTQRQSPPSPPAVLTLDQTIQLDPLPSSVSISSGTITVSATALSNGIANKQQVSFAATGPCSVSGLGLDQSTGISSAKVTLNNTGSCTITASQAGDSTAVPLVQPAYNAADPVSGTFAIVSATSNTVAQTINFPQLANVQYGSAPVPVSATASPSGFTVTFATIGPCSMASSNQIKISGAGVCKVTASAPSGPGPNNTTYSAATITQSFTINPAALTVTAGDITVPYGKPIPSLATDYTITGFVNGETSAVLNNTAPAISTTATASSAPGTYPIVVSTGTLAATNYSFRFVNGTLTLAANVPTSGTACNGTYSGSFKGNLTVSKGQTCTFYGGGVSGSITGTGGNIILIGATVGSSVTIQSGGMFNFGPMGATPTMIKGNFTAQSLPKSTTLNQVCGTNITGTVVYQSNGAPLSIGSGSTSCAVNKIGGNLQVTSNSAAVSMNGDQVSGSIQVQSNSGATAINGNAVGVSVQDQSNTGATQIFNNTIVNALQCQSNAAITGGGNKAAVKQGQCAKF